MALRYEDGLNPPNTKADEVQGLVQILDKLETNQSNLISAKDVRDSVYTLWLKTEDASSNANTVLYSNQTPVPTTIGGIEAGATFSNTRIQDVLDELLYPYIPLTTSLSIAGNNIREFGNPSGLNTNSITLNWSVDKKSDIVTQIIIDGEAFTPTGNDQSGTKLTTGTHSTFGSSQESNTFSMTAKDGTITSSDSTDLIWRNRIYWGRLDLSSLSNPNPNLTTGTSSISEISGEITSTLIRQLDGAGVGSGNELSNTKNRSYDGIDGSINDVGYYLIFAWPSSVPNSKNPKFIVNGQPNSAFTQIKTDWEFTNQYNFKTNYEVWVSNTIQYSPISTFKIT